MHPPLFEKSGVFCRSACPAIARRATADCRGRTYINLSYPYSRKRALHFCRRQKASHCEAMLHDGCNPSLHILSLPLFQKKRSILSLQCRGREFSGELRSFAVFLMVQFGCRFFHIQPEFPVFAQLFFERIPGIFPDETQRFAAGQTCRPR